MNGCLKDAPFSFHSPNVDIATSDWRTLQIEIVWKPALVIFTNVDCL
uniref:Uncharacterized protein n=1 Tax=Rhizophora mucronata TaxID=61149 RepID=A0A2P2N3Y6_RHIMU